MKNRTILLIDGSNFYYKLKELKLNHLLKFNFTKFKTFLNTDNQITSSCYYVGKIRQDGTKKTKLLFDNQQKLIGSLKKSGFKYSLGYLMKNDGVYHEKGVDVQIATDILIATYENLADKIIIVSSDTDLQPAIKKAREKGKTIEYIGFSHKPSIAMISFCNTSRLLTKEEVLKFFI